MANELATVKDFDLLQMGTGEMGELAAEEMEGLGDLPIDNVKVPSGGSLAFEVPTEDPESPDTVRELVGVIVYHHATNAYWRNSFSGSNEEPDCRSFDGKQGVDYNGEVHSCVDCPRNQFTASGKQCKNMHRLYILRPGNPIPMMLTLPPTSIKSMRDYIGRSIVAKGRRSYQVVTSITLKKATNPQGIVYSKVNFRMLGLLPQEYWQAAKALSADLKVRKESMAANMEPAYTETNDEHIPFDDAPSAPMPFDAPPERQTDLRAMVNKLDKAAADPEQVTFQDVD